MAALILSREGLALADIPLRQEPVTIGRLPANRIQVDVPAFAGRHAAIAFLDGEYVLDDLGSPQGTRVNGEPVKRHLLRPGDRIGIGKYQLEFVGEPPAAPAGEELPPPAVIRILDGPHAGRELSLAKARTTLGRAGAQVLAILRRPAGYFIVHEEGDDLPLLNGRGLAGGEHPLADRDEIRIAGVRMEFSMESPGQGVRT